MTFPKQNTIMRTVKSSILEQRGSDYVSQINLNYIKARREALKITQNEMAEKLGFSNSSVYCKYENGAYKFNAETLPMLAKILKCKIQNFFT